MRNIRFYLIVSFLILSLVKAYGQFYPVQVTPQLIPPYSVYLSDYATPGNEKLRIIAVQRDITEPSLQVRLVMSIEWNGQIIMRTSRAFNPAPITLNPGIPSIISGAELAPYLDSRNIDFIGYSRDQYERTKSLPEGSYQIIFTAYDYKRQDVQISNNGGSFYYLAKSEPPLINFPACGTTIPMRTPQQIIFSWLPRNTASPNSADRTLYEFSLHETRPAGRNPNDVVLSTQPVFRTTVELTQLIYGPAEPLLLEGMKYVWRVKATDENGRDAFRNNGYSEVCTFTYGGVDPAFNIGVVQNLQATGETERKARISWKKGEYDGYKINYKKTGATYEWFSSEVTTASLSGVTDGELKIYDLEPDTEYETRVQATKSGVVGPYSEIVKFRTTPRRIAQCGEQTPMPEAGGNPLRAAIRGTTIDVDGVEMTLLDAVSPANDGWYKGYAKVNPKILGGASYTVKFDRLFLREDHKAGFGHIDILTKGVAAMVEEQLASQEKRKEKEQQQTGNNEGAGAIFHEKIFTFNNTIIDTIYTDSNNNVVMVDEHGQSTIIPEVPIILKDAPEKAIIIQDKSGDQFVVQKDKQTGKTNVTKVEGGGLNPGNATSPEVAALNVSKQNILGIVLGYFKEETAAWLRINGKGGEDDPDVLLALALPECFPQDADKIKLINESTIPYFENHKSELQQKIETDQSNKQLFDRVGKSFLGKEVVWSEVSEEDQQAIRNATCEAIVESDNESAMVVLAPLDVGTYDPLDPHILKKIQENISAINVNMQDAPSQFMGEKTRAAYGRKWNVRWAFDQIDKIYPDFWSEANKAKIRNGILPVVDEKYLQFIGKGLSPDAFNKLKAVAALDNSIQHHHMNHGNFAVSLQTTIHTGATNTKFWHNPKFRNVASRTIKSMSQITAKSLLIIGFAISVQEVLSGDLSSAVSSMSGLPQNDIIDDVSINLIEEGLLSDIYEKVKIGLTLLEDERFTVNYWSADDLLAHLNGVEIKESFVSHTIDEQWPKDFPYLVVKFEGEMVGIVNIPD